ncbi:MurR/RpiR family transcriptional regulator [Brevibacterium aurantiacum]|uniref:MurR/RpiR family transcriptional regulator n=1 Tax=Brevibacterium aurantiacum TaxID=273384 RepID=A0A556CCD0_BREAU|nr:MurR/RpiR family transcriptional regulator [Brevibacterium aurantiacum]TSI15099.1 MurR/RpiR family transcriptional regulator [Brevibacterium aurantiacum]
MSENRPPQFDLTGLSAQEKRVGQFATREPLKFATSSVSAIAHWAGTSEATVIRAARSLGFTGIKEMKVAYAHSIDGELSLTATIRAQLDELASAGAGATPAQVATKVASDISDLLLRTASSLESDELSRTCAAIEQCTQTFLFGLGSARYIADYLSLSLDRLGFATSLISDAGHASADALAKLSESTPLIVFAPHAIFPEIEVVMRLALENATTMVLISQELPPPDLDSSIIHLPISSAVGTAATESAGAWLIADVIVAEIARRNSDAAVTQRQKIQKYRDQLTLTRSEVRRRRPR